MVLVQVAALSVVESVRVGPAAKAMPAVPIRAAPTTRDTVPMAVSNFDNCRLLATPPHPLPFRPDRASPRRTRLPTAPPRQYGRAHSHHIVTIR